jgi:hypothetical protein
MSPLDVRIVALGATRDEQAIDCILEKVGQLTPSSEFSHHRAVALALEMLADPAAAQPLANLLAQPGMTGYAFTNINAPPIGGGGDDGIRGSTLRELILARALYRCGDYNGIAEGILNQYEGDLRGLYANYAHAIIKDGYPDLNNDCMTDTQDLIMMIDKWLDSGDKINVDLNRDGKVDFKDFTILSKRWFEREMWPSSYLP